MIDGIQPKIYWPNPDYQSYALGRVFVVYTIDSALNRKWQLVFLKVLGVTPMLTISRWENHSGFKKGSQNGGQISDFLILGPFANSDFVQMSSIKHLFFGLETKWNTNLVWASWLNLWQGQKQETIPRKVHPERYRQIRADWHASDCFSTAPYSSAWVKVSDWSSTDTDDVCFAVTT